MGRKDRGAGSGEGRGGSRSASSSQVGQRGPPQFLNQTQIFSSSSSSSSNSQRDHQGGGSQDQGRRSQGERENRERDERHEAKVTRDDERDRVEQERFQSQVPQRGADYPNQQFQRPEQGSFRALEQGRGGFSDRRMPPPGPALSDEQLRIAFMYFSQQHAQQQMSGYQEGPSFEGQRRDEGRTCHSWIRNGQCSFGDRCKFLHYQSSSGFEDENYAKRARRD